MLENDTLAHLPFLYDFDDIFGDKKWSQMFVTILVDSHSGNCHSLPYLSKIIVNEIDFDVRLAVAPNHVYVKTHSQQYGWFNIELTSGTFPMNVGLMASSYVSMDAIRNGTYMIKLTEEESIALCLGDLAKGYAHKYPENDGSFILSVQTWH